MAGEGVSSFRSILDKPLNQLTEHDISQLTREDCRKYLKEKGMRRPSWNKSQAIQQVISLKALLEPTDDSGAGALRRIFVTKASPAKGTVSDSFRTDGLPAEDRDAAADPRDFDGLRACSVDQMTIFYCGKVNVYERVPVEKARAIMHLAANQCKGSNDFVAQRSAFFSSPTRLWGQSDGFPFPSTSRPVEKVEDHASILKNKGLASLDGDAEGHGCRKVSLQRYLEKKRDRGKFKCRKGTEGSSSGVGMFLDFNPVADTKGHESGSPVQKFQLSSLSRDVNPAGRLKMYIYVIEFYTYCLNVVHELSLLDNVDPVGCKHHHFHSNLQRALCMYEEIMTAQAKEIVELFRRVDDGVCN